MSENHATPIPELYRVRQPLVRGRDPDFLKSFAARLEDPGFTEFLKGARRVALCAGSRGIRFVGQMMAIAARAVIKTGAELIIVPAMGSHGGACAEGQKEVLESLGITQELCGAPIRSSMDVIDTGPTPEGCRAYMARQAYECDAIVVLNRVKDHTDFFSDTESGIMKMLAVGLGNHEGASYIHDHGVVGLTEYIPSIARHFIGIRKVAGIAVIEDGYAFPSESRVLIGSHIPQAEAELLKIARRNKSSIPFRRLDCLVLEEFGKEISGAGLDSKVVGRIRYHGVKEPESPSPNIICALRLTDGSHGNAAGMGLLDLISKRFFESIDMDATRINGTTSKCPERYKMPLYLDTDRETVETAVRFARACADYEEKMLHIKNTKELETLYISKELLKEAEQKGLEVISREPVRLRFRENGDFASLFE